MTRNDHLDHNLKRLMKDAVPVRPMPTPLKDHVRAVVLAQAEATGEARRQNWPWLRMAIAAVIPFVVVLTVYLGGGSGIAFAQVLESLQGRGYAFSYWSKDRTQTLKEMGRGMVLPPRYLRWDMPDEQFKGLAIVFDAQDRKSRWVTTSGKDLGEVEMPAEVSEPSEGPFLLLRPVENLWGIVDGTEESLGDATKAGVAVTGYRVQKQEMVFNIWANTATGLPHEVSIDLEDPNGATQKEVIVIRDFDFDTLIDESLFGGQPKHTIEDVHDDRFLLTPGVGMGQLLLGDAERRVKEVLGDPEFMVGEGLYQYTGFVVVAREGKVYSFQCGAYPEGPGARHWKACRCRTPEGIAIGSSEAEITKAYGEPSRRSVQHNIGALHLIYRHHGMGLVLKDNAVYYMAFGHKSSETH